MGAWATAANKKRRRMLLLRLILEHREGIFASVRKERNNEQRHRRAPEDTLEQIGPFLHPIPISTQLVFVQPNGHFSSLGAFYRVALSKIHANFISVDLLCRGPSWMHCSLFGTISTGGKVDHVYEKNTLAYIAQLGEWAWTLVQPNDDLDPISLDLV